MTLLTGFLLYAALFRVAVIVAGVVSIFLGYRLLVRGVMPGGRTEAGAEVGGIKLTVKNAAPGTCFALFGVVIIIAMLVQGSPELVLEELASKAEELGSGEIPDAQTDLVHRTVRLKGPPDAVARFDAYTQAGLEREQTGDIEGARAAYATALGEAEVSLRHAASALNQVAWGYFQQQRLEEALAIVRIAVIAEPTSSAYFDTLAQIQIARGEIDEAVKLTSRRSPPQDTQQKGSDNTNSTARDYSGYVVNYGLASPNSGAVLRQELRGRSGHPGL